MDFYENSSNPEKVLLVSVNTGDFDCELSLNELAELTRTAGAEVFCTVTQNRDKPDPATFVGSGILEQIKTTCEDNEIDLIIVDAELSPAQQRNIEKESGVRTIDRTTLILDIFALNAKTAEGKLQVELAQLQYMLPRLSGMGTSMSRLGGGIGTRGPGESKLESDRRHIRRRIHSLQEDFLTLQKRRFLHRERRHKDSVTCVAIVGYTNAGKSTLLNALTDADVLVEDKLFATLDPTSRALKLPDGRSVMFIDTVGFISRLPHKLVQAFRSTLEEVVDADLILNICDASDENYPSHLKVTTDLLHELGVVGTPIITVLNKCDVAADFFVLPDKGDIVRLSALKKIGIEDLLNKVADALPPTRRFVKLLLPFSLGSLAARIRKEGAVDKEEYTPDGLYMECTVDMYMLDELKEYLQ